MLTWFLKIGKVRNNRIWKWNIPSTNSISWATRWQRCSCCPSLKVSLNILTQLVVPSIRQYKYAPILNVSFENLAPQVSRQICKELQHLISDPPEGIKVILNEEDISDIQAIIDGPAGTPYACGHFRVKLVLGKDFPSGPPKGFFLTKIFHPNVSQQGEICVNTLKKDWKPDLGIKHIFLTIKCLLIVPNPESALNEEAGKLLLEHYEDYFQRAKMMTEIHAKINQHQSSIDTHLNEDTNLAEGPTASKKAATDRTVLADKKKPIVKDKKRTLKRLVTDTGISRDSERIFLIS
ncbi:hypothetical protein OUZ56_015186 [Daphnia magna]|uniref:UBC core domain-containing protein n=1 Tax=Daphnia magna TaxID=35525 RepID=A0ABR0AM26_9CRUS|nr:hypothetical protein OUZ56_015186 [Daphnia magna]